MNVLDVSHLSVKRGDREVLHDLSFSVQGHELLAVIGPNGGGKSTLLRALLGLIPAQGEIVWHAKDRVYLPPLDQINRSGLPPLTVQEFFSFHRHFHGAEKLLIEVGLDPSYMNRYFDTLSTGEFQRMMLAWTLVHRAGVVLLDEPTAGLDIAGERRIFSFLQQGQNRTVIIATHHVHSALEFADHILFINRQQLYYGTGEETTIELLRELYAELGVSHGH